MSYQGRGCCGSGTSIAELVKQAEKDRTFFQQSGGGVTFSGENRCARAWRCARRWRCSGRAASTPWLTPAATPLGAARPGRRPLRWVPDDITCPTRCIGNRQGWAMYGFWRIAQAMRGRLARLRLPIIPGCNDERGKLDGNGGLFAGCACGAFTCCPTMPRGAHTGKMHRAYALEGIQPPTDEAMARIAQFSGARRDDDDWRRNTMNQRVTRLRERSRRRGPACGSGPN